MTTKKFFIGAVVGTIILTVILALPTIIVDPYFHYRAPEGTYKLNNQRYQNNGIAKYFEYDALIIGSSMTENFKTSEFDLLFGTNSIKLPHAGAHFLEIDNAIKTALNANDDLKMVLRSLELDYINLDKDSMRYDSYPTYLYDDNLLNDVNYFLNKEVLFDATREAIKYQRAGKESTSFDMYSSWTIEENMTEQIASGSFKRRDIYEGVIDFSDTDREQVLGNIQQNVVKTVQDNPDVTFYLFFPPYSSLYFDSIIRGGQWENHIEMQKCVIEELLQYENIKLFSFCNYYDITCNLDYYRDVVHYGPEINGWILKRMAAGDGLLTKENYMDYLDSVQTYYLNLDRDGYFERKTDE